MALLERTRDIRTSPGEHTRDISSGSKNDVELIGRVEQGRAFVLAFSSAREMSEPVNRVEMHRAAKASTSRPTLKPMGRKCSFPRSSVGATKTSFVVNPVSESLGVAAGVWLELDTSKNTCRNINLAVLIYATSKQDPQSMTPLYQWCKQRKRRDNNSTESS